MLFGETVAVYCENHTEHTDTVRTSQEPYGTHRYSPYLTDKTDDVKDSFYEEFEREFDRFPKYHKKI
jgi:hypothetical protein